MTNLITPEVLKKYDEVLSRGLCTGIGQRDGQMCIEAAICYALDLPHGDQPNCVTQSIIKYKVSLNDSSYWPSNQERAAGLYALGIAQIGSLGVVSDKDFMRVLAKKTIQRLLPALFREIFTDKKLLDAADICESEGTSAAAAAAYAAYAAYAASSAAAYASSAAASAASVAAYASSAAASSASAAAYASSAAYAYAAAAAASAASAGSKYLHLSAKLALETLRELKSPGCEWLDYLEEQKKKGE